MVPNTDWCTPSVIRVTPSVACTASCAIALKSEVRRLLVGRLGEGVMGFEGICKCNASSGPPPESPGIPGVTYFRNPDSKEASQMTTVDLIVIDRLRSRYLLKLLSLCSHSFSRRIVLCHFFITS